MTALQTRKPTGLVGWPLILVEGEEKAGKTFMALQLSASPRVGRTFVLDLGDGTADEYATLGDYEVLIHDGTWSSMLAQVEAAARVPSDPAKPNVIIFDAGTPGWNLLKARAEQRARGSQRAKALLAQDPDAEIDVSMPYWNDVKDRWARLLQVLKTFPGIGVITAQGREVTKVENGQPTRETEWSIEAEKTTAQWASAWVRIRRPHLSTLIGARSLHVQVPQGGLSLPDHDVLDHLVFDLLGAGGFGPSTAVAPLLGVPVAQAKGRVLSAVKRAFPNMGDQEAKAEAARLWAAAGLDGKQEVTEQDLRRAMPDASPEDPEPPPAGQDPPPPPESGPEAGPQEAPAAQEAEAGPTEPEAPPEAPTPSEDGQPLQPQEWAAFGNSPEVALATIGAMGKPDLVAAVSQAGLRTSGTKEDLIDRLATFLGITPAEVAPHPWESSIPEDAFRAVCLCGEPVWHPKGDASKLQHAEPALDLDHDPDPSF